MELAGILFDVDGTIAESEEVHRKSFNESFKEFGVKWHWDRAIYKELLNIEGGRERIQYYIERTDPDQLNRPDLSSFISSIHDAKSQVYSALMTKEGVPIRPGALRLIKEAKKEGLKLAIVTASTEESLRALFQYLPEKDLLNYFDVIADGDKVPVKKPAPDIYTWTLQELGLSAKACFALEDSPTGLQSSLSAGIPTIVTVSSFTKGENLSGATLVLSDLGEPSVPFKVLEGDVLGHSFVSIAMLKQFCKKSN
ncbi:MAG: HAD-IA family hydrolase [Alphaproteobacteria bacterium]|jgi:HAD superfamily hydrolase (TIGR01509 family)|nr:HAD-IA family hydrolase [Alphaproteobacteria bacterium]|tara:strand:- start:153 stop:914 length:762 start_codon:yes stop_codon:yes gene_type:complete